MKKNGFTQPEEKKTVFGKDGIKEVSKEIALFEGAQLPEGVTPESLKAMYEADMHRTMDGVIPRLPQVEILHQTTQAFKMPDESIVKSFEGIIIDQNPCNAYWEKSFADTGGGVQPTCSSLGAKVGSLPGQTIDGHPCYGECSNCWLNTFGTSIEKDGSFGKGKGCKNMKRLVILMDGHELPWRLTLPPSSILEADTFFTGLLDRKLPMTAIRVRFSLTEAKSSGGISYSQIQFTPLDQIDINLYLTIQKFLKEHLAQIRGQKIETEEYVATEEEDDDIPF